MLKQNPLFILTRLQLILADAILEVYVIPCHKLAPLRLHIVCRSIHPAPLNSSHVCLYSLCLMYKILENFAPPKIRLWRRSRKHPIRLFYLGVAKDDIVEMILLIRLLNLLHGHIALCTKHAHVKKT